MISQIQITINCSWKHMISQIQITITVHEHMISQIQITMTVREHTISQIQITMQISYKPRPFKPKQENVLFSYHRKKTWKNRKKVD